jgi:hypothetical protein
MAAMMAARVGITVAGRSAESCADARSCLSRSDRCIRPHVPHRARQARVAEGLISCPSTPSAPRPNATAPAHPHPRRLRGRVRAHFPIHSAIADGVALAGVLAGVMSALALRRLRLLDMTPKAKSLTPRSARCVSRSHHASRDRQRAGPALWRRAERRGRAGWPCSDRARRPTPAARFGRRRSPCS